MQLNLFHLPNSQKMVLSLCSSPLSCDWLKFLLEIECLRPHRRPQTHMWNSKAQGDGIRRWGQERWLWPHKQGQQPLRDLGELPALSRWGCRDTLASGDPEVSSHPTPNLLAHGLGLSASTIDRNGFLLFISHPVYGLLLVLPRKTNVITLMLFSRGTHGKRIDHYTFKGEIQISWIENFAQHFIPGGSYRCIIVPTHGMSLWRNLKLARFLFKQVTWFFLRGAGGSLLAKSSFF